MESIISYLFWEDVTSELLNAVGDHVLENTRFHVSLGVFLRRLQFRDPPSTVTFLWFVQIKEYQWQWKRLNAEHNSSESNSEITYEAAVAAMVVVVAAAADVPPVLQQDTAGVSG